LAILCDQGRHYVSPYVFNLTQINMPHPVEIPARNVEQGFGPDACE
jgi:hypothetical protein